MGLTDGLRRFFALEPLQQAPQPLRTRETVPGSLEDFAYRILGNTARRAYRKPSIRQALEVPAVLNAVTKIANITGSLSMEVLRDGERVERPSIIRRPNPLTTPRDFFRDVAYSMAVYGESWLWIAKREPSDDRALALVPVSPLEIRLEERAGSLPIIRWGDREMPREDMLQITYLREPGTSRGVGPLQFCGAAVSVAVEAQDWAANFYADGGHPSVVIKHAHELDPTLDDDGLSEADRLRQQWVDRPNNVPRIIDQNIDDVEYHAPNESAAQMLSARMYQNGEVANMFGIPGSLLEYNAQGSSLTYKSIPDLMRQFVELCLAPNYLEPIEQVMSDLLPRSQIARFETAGLLRADIKTQYEVATMGFEKGVLDRPEARAMVGLEPSIEVEPVPFAPPRAVPNVQRSGEPLRCTACGRSRMIVYAGGTLRCVGCKTERTVA
jgi:HK97 family phage portal protein